MPVELQPHFTRQAAPVINQIGLVIPPNAEISPNASVNARRLAELGGPPTVVPSGFSFAYVDWPLDNALLVDDAQVDTGLYAFRVKDAVVSVFDLARWGSDEFCWSFSSSAQRDVVAALRIGETFDVQFDVPLEQAFHVLKYTFPPPGISDSGYGLYAIHLAVDQPRPEGLRVVSAFEPGSKRTNSRLPFLFGFRIFGTAKGDEPQPVWRTLLGAAVRQACENRWAQSLLYTAFSLESFIDMHLEARLRTADLGEYYVEHVLRMGARDAELSAIYSPSQRLSKKALRSLDARLNEAVFAPRNRLAHGRVSDESIEPDLAVDALKVSVDFIWDCDANSRHLLLTPMRDSSFDALIDEQLLHACQEEG